MSFKNASLLIIMILLLSGCSPYKQQLNTSPMEKKQESKNTLWPSLHETTWWKDNGLAGETYVFYIDDQGSQKCIHQVQGSGVHITSRRLAQIEIINDREIKIDNTLYTFTQGQLISEESILTLHSDEPLIYDRMGSIDLKTAKDPEFDVENIDVQPKE